MTDQFLIRQGDVLIVATDNIPAAAKPIPLENGRLILAHGEVTGHAHVVEGDAVFLAADLDEMADRFLKVLDTAGLVDSWVCSNGNGTCWIPAYVDRDVVEAAGFTVLGRQDVQGVVETHDEHLPHVVPPGMYVVRRQREYMPGAIRNVAD